MAPTSLKSQVVAILTAVSAIAGTPVKALLSIAIWAIGYYLPDDAEGDPVLVSAAPDGVKNAVRGLFDRAVGMISNAFYRRMVQSAADLVLNHFVDTAWDALAKVVTVSATPPAAETEADKMATAALAGAAL